ncbi:hypothetical protein SEUCBS139899_003859 [Sporothrix eucalyptigena]|uniref:Dead deah box DNA helicase n=1 Tax=Sporothrix eucalyptigena TaxID=1812306 RepID=A0ABP0D1W0_9PEZI
MDATNLYGGSTARPQKLAISPTPPFSSSSTTLVPATDVAALLNPSPDALFESVDAIFALIENAIRTGDDSVVVASTSAKQYNALCRERDARGRKFRLFYLGTQIRILIITVPTKSHEGMHYLLSTRLVVQIAQMGLNESWSSSAAATLAGPSNSGGEADGNILPFPARAGADQWPTIVFEAGYSQSEESLRAKMNWWFQASNHNVKIVVLAKAFPQTLEKRLKIEQWQERSVEAVRSGATATRRSTAAAGAALQPTCLQTINISWAGLVPFHEATLAQVADRQQYNVVRAPLVLEFGLVFLRPAVGPGEHDFEFPTEFLQRYAARVWSSTR